MLQKASEEVANCLRRAAEAESCAHIAISAKTKAEYQRIADTWRTLARSYEVQGSLGRFISYNESRKKAPPFILPANRQTISSAGPADAAQAAELASWLASIVEFSDDAIVSKNLDGIITSWNKGAERVFGYTAEEAIGQPITLVIPQDRHKEELEILTHIRRGEHIDHFKTIRQHKNGSFITVSLTISPIKNADGKIVGASKIARDITEQERAQEQIATLAREAEHRSKNLLASVQAAVNLSHADTPEGLKQAIGGRIQALANVHSLFVANRWSGADLLTIAARELAPYSENDETRVRIDGPQVLLEPNAAQAIAVTLHELATNAAKYGSLSVANGRVDLEWSPKPNGQLHLRWTETGGPPVRNPTRKGFGSQIIEQMIASLKGKTSRYWDAEGLICEINLQTLVGKN